MLKQHWVKWLLCCGVVLAAMQSVAADVKQPEQVKNALRILAYVQDDMSRKLTSGRYDMLPHENQEFQEAAVPMMESVTGEPETFKAEVETLLKKAQDAASHVAEVSVTKDKVQIEMAIEAVAGALKPLNELFPEELRPVPGQLGSGPRGSGGPPPDLR